MRFKNIVTFFILTATLACSTDDTFNTDFTVNELDFLLAGQEGRLSWQRTDLISDIDLPDSIACEQSVFLMDFIRTAPNQSNLLIRACLSDRGTTISSDTLIWEPTVAFEEGPANRINIFDPLNTDQTINVFRVERLSSSFLTITYGVVIGQNRRFEVTESFERLTN
ncbi:MAG: hypothetical protein LAT68_12240 [Cyclobacteriaceae bacterium]|nr:hypothetical protein [Cyclobacteriaceae bacterium]MCH8517087.1 hypothetical protein [Cyclobacteriaceae bacterium]